MSRYDGNKKELEKFGKKNKIKKKEKTTLNKFVIFFNLFPLLFEQEHICTVVFKAYIEIRYRRFLQELFAAYRGDGNLIEFKSWGKKK